MNDQRGSITLAHVYAVALSLLLFTVLTNLVVHQYGHGVLRAAVDEAARAGARTAGSEAAAHAACQRSAARVREGLLGSRFGSDAAVWCEVTEEHVIATAAATFPGWLVLVPDWDVEVAATVLREGTP